MKKLILSIIAIVCLSGCRGHTVSGLQTKMEIKAKAALTADMEIGPMVTGQSSSIQVLGIFHYFHDNKFYESVDKAEPGIFSKFFDFNIIHPTKAAAAYKAFIAGGADALISPSYIVEVHDYLFWKNIYVTAHAYPANIKGYRQVKSNNASIRY